MQTAEELREIAGYDGDYFVSSIGNVYSKKSGKLRPLHQKPYLGYRYVFLCKNAKVKGYRVHRLVAMAFLPNPNKYPQVNHIDENKANNQVDNLEWCQAKYNANYGTKLERAAKKLSKKVQQIDISTNCVICVFESIKAAAESSPKFNRSHIGACCHNRRDTHGGYKWKFAT